jgi:hypothetical protein
LAVPLSFFALLFWVVRAGSGALPFLVAAVLLLVLSGKDISLSQSFALAIQAAGLLSLTYFPHSRWATGLHTVGLLGAVEFFPFFAPEGCPGPLPIFCHGAYLYALLIRPPTGAVNCGTVLVIAVCSFFWGVFFAIGERSVWRQASAILHGSLAVAFAIFLLLPNLRASAAGCQSAILFSTSLLATLLPGSVYGQELKGLLAENPSRAVLFAITWVLICLCPAAFLLPYCLPPLAALHSALPAFLLCLCLALPLAVAIRTVTSLSILSERSIGPGLREKIGPLTGITCLVQLFFALFFAAASCRLG